MAKKNDSTKYVKTAIQVSFKGKIITLDVFVKDKENFDLDDITINPEELLSKLGIMVEFNEDSNSFTILNEAEITDFLKDSKCDNIPSMALTNLLKRYVNNPIRLESPRRGQIKTQEEYLSKDLIITYKGNDGEYTVSVERVKELFAKRVQNGTKIFNFLLQKLNEQNYQEHTEFLLSELVGHGIYANLDSAYRGLKNVTDKLMRIYVEGKVVTYQAGKRKETANVKAPLISQRIVTYNQCRVTLPPIIRDSAPAIMILPNWCYSLSSENAYMLSDYIFYLARQNTDKIKERGYFTISLNSIRIQLGLPDPEVVKTEHNRRYNQLIINPIEEAITAIEDVQQKNELTLTHLTITPIYNPNYKNIHEYLDGYIEIRISGSVYEYLVERAVVQEKKRSERKRLEDKKGLEQ